MRIKRNSFDYLFILMGRLTALKPIRLVALAGVIIIAGSCDNDDDPVDPNVIFTATIDGAQEVPAVTTSATGTATLTFNSDTKIFTIVVNFSGVTATASHIHKAAAGSSGGVEFPFDSPVTSPINYTSVALDATQEADLFADLYYVNIHSAAFGGGEIRGQLIRQ